MQIFEQIIQQNENIRLTYIQLPFSKREVFSIEEDYLC